MRNRHIESVIAVAIFAVLAFGSGESGSSGSASSNSSTAAASTAPRSPPTDVQMPQSERDFCAVVADTAAAYDAARRAGANELKLTAIRTARARALVKAMHNRGVVKDWVGTIAGMSTTGDGRAAVKVDLPCSVTVSTWNNSLSDTGSGTLIPQSSKLYDAFADLQKGATIRFSGKLEPDDKNGFHEKSMTESGSMTDPDFLITFSAVASGGAK